MLQATSALKTLGLEIPKRSGRWGVSELGNRMKKNPALCLDCRSYAEYHGLAFEMGLRLRLADLAKDHRFKIAPCVGDCQPYFGNTYPGDSIENWGRVYLSGSEVYTRKREYDSVVLLNGVGVVFEATISTQMALERIDPINIEKHLSPLKKRLDRDFGYVVVTMGNFLGSLSGPMRDKIKDFEKNGGLFVPIPLSLHNFCDEVDRYVKRARLPIYKPIQCAPAIASWDHIKTRERRKQSRSFRDIKEREHRIHERRALNILEQRLGLGSHLH